jgi:hypothetical protein
MMNEANHHEINTGGGIEKLSTRLKVKPRGQFVRNVSK